MAETNDENNLRWTVKESWEYYNSHEWKVGGNYIPSTASNSIEMWTKDTFDEKTIKRELKYASQMGYNTMRVFLHNLIYDVEGEESYLNRIDKYLHISSSYNISTILVLFDGSWNPNPTYGKQKLPRDGIYNSQWVQCPGKYYLTNNETAQEDFLKPYVQSIISRFGINDTRVVAWDLYNEPGQDNYFSYGKGSTGSSGNPVEEELSLQDKVMKSTELLMKTMSWVREVAAGSKNTKLYAPITVGTWEQHRHRISPNHNNNKKDDNNDVDGTFELTEEEGFLFNWIWENSDILSFHNHQDITRIQSYIRSLKELGRPIICTEYLARDEGSTFDPILGYLQKQNIWAFHGGFVNGKTQLHYPIESWIMNDEDDRGKNNNGKGSGKHNDVLWHQDLLHPNGKAYNDNEISYIKEINSQAATKATTTSSKFVIIDHLLMDHTKSIIVPTFVIMLLAILGILYFIGIRRRKSSSSQIDDDEIEMNDQNQRAHSALDGSFFDVNDDDDSIDTNMYSVYSIQ